MGGDTFTGSEDEEAGCFGEGHGQYSALLEFCRGGTEDRDEERNRSAPKRVK